jgi:hypothetical protein
LHFWYLTPFFDASPTQVFSFDEALVIPDGASDEFRLYRQLIYLYNAGSL